MAGQAEMVAGRVLLGIDLGSSAARAVLMAAGDHAILGAGEAAYPSGIDGVIGDPCDPEVARQHPGDYLSALSDAVRGAVAVAVAAGHVASGQSIAAIGVCTTGSTPVPVDRAVRPLALDPRWEGRSAALAWMWKDHSAAAEAAELRAAAPEGWLGSTGGQTSSEWLWAKLLRCLRADPALGAATAGWIELQDLIPALLCGVTDVAAVHRGVCAAGHKGHWDPARGGWPSAEFLDRLHPDLAHAAGPLPAPVSHAGAAGALSAAWAGRLGLRAGIPVAVGLLDAHAGAIACGVAPGRLVRIMGTSSCDIAVVRAAACDIATAGLAGAVDGSVLPGFAGVEAGQAAVGDLFAWGARLLAPGQPMGAAIAALSTEAAKLRPGETGLLALDWNNGNRSVLMDPALSGLILGQTLGTTAAHMFRALVEASCLGARRIRAQFLAAGIPVTSLVVSGGVVERNPLVCRVMADCLGVPLLLAAADNASARGAAIVASVAAGLQADIPAAQGAMCPPATATVAPDPAATAVYDRLYPLFEVLHDGFGRGAARPLGELMPALRSLRAEAARRPLTASEGPAT